MTQKTITTPQGHCNGTFYQRDSGNPKCGKCGALPNEKCAETKTTKYAPKMVKKILAAKNAPTVKVPSDEKGFLKWLNSKR